MKRILIVVMMFAGLEIIGTGCGGPSNADKPVTDTVIISAMAFHPAELTVNKNDTVIWINKGLVAHNVTEFPDSHWASDTIPPGISWKKAIDSSFDYFCSIHPTMKGKITVKH